MAMETFKVLFMLKARDGSERWITDIVDIETPPTDPDELKTAIWIKLMARNPGAKEIVIISIQ